MLVAEYRKFKAKNVKHFRFNSVANFSAFGKSFFGPLRSILTLSFEYIFGTRVV
jgi:hypothetical protein